jgi:hypothetical protein
MPEVEKTMSNQPVLNVQEGIWIDKRWLEQAGLGEKLQIVIQHGEIHILAALEVTQASDSVEDVWTEEAINVFRSLGQNADAGQLKDTSINHDHYLYSKPE